MPAPTSPAKRVKTSHRTPAAPTLVPTEPGPPPTLTNESSTHHRLFVGGCPIKLTPPQLHDELQRRFSSFGRVTAVDVIAGDGGCKGFAYVDLQTDRLAAVLSTFKGSKWRGQWFRVEPAQPDYLTRLHQQWTIDPTVEQPIQPPPSAEGIAAKQRSQTEWEQYVYCFRVRPGVRVRVPHQHSIKHFDTVPPLPLHQLSDSMGRDEEIGEEVEGDEVEGEREEEERKESEEAFRQRLQQSKEEVERVWLPAQPQPEQLTKKQRVALKRREREERQRADAMDAEHHEREHEQTEEAEEAEEEVLDVPSEEELGVVEFDDEEEAAEKGREEKDREDGMTEEERLKWQEEKEWAMLEDEGGEWLDEQKVELDKSEQDEQEQAELEDGSNVSPQLADGEMGERAEKSELDEWAALEEEKEEGQVDVESDEEAERVAQMPDGVVDMDDEAEEEHDHTKQPSPAAMDKIAFPKLSAADWFDDDDEPAPAAASSLPSTPMEQRMRALSSRLVASQGEFNVRPAYEGRSGQQLLRLKQTYNGDERFALDNRFAAAAVDQQKAAQERDEDETDEHNEEVAAGDEEKELKRQLYAETVRALQVLDEVAPGPTPFHTTLPRFSHATDKRATESGVSEVEKDAAAIEAELNESEMRKSVTMWRKIQRYDPDKDDTVYDTTKKGQQRADKTPQNGVETDNNRTERTRPESKTERKRRLRQERQERQQQQREQAATTQSHWPTADDGETEERPSSSQQQPAQAAAPLYELGVTRLRDLVTDRSTVVQFSFAFDSSVAAAGDSSAVSTEAESDVALNVYAPSTQLFPTRPAAVAVLPSAAAVQPIAGAALVKRSDTLHSSIAHQQLLQSSTAARAIPPTSASKSRLSDILALAQHAHSQDRGSSGGKAGTAVGVPAAASSDEEGEDDGLFMRRSAEGEMESEWRRWRANIRDDYKKKNKLAVRQESNRQTRSSTALPWANSKRKKAAAG